MRLSAKDAAIQIVALEASIGMSKDFNETFNFRLAQSNLLWEYGFIIAKELLKIPEKEVTAGKTALT